MAIKLISTKDLRLRELWQSRGQLWFIAFFLGAITLLATVALLAVSGWFISAAALAGLSALSTAYGFDYFRPAAIIRSLAIMRTAGRYGERLASHHAVLSLLRDLRCRFFKRLAENDSSIKFASDQMMHRLTSDIDLLDQWPLRFLMPWLWSLLLQATFIIWLLLIAPNLLFWLLPPLLLAGIMIPVWAARQGLTLAKKNVQLSEVRRSHLLQPLSIITSLILWKQWSRCEALFLQSDLDYAVLQKKQQFLSSVCVWLQQCLLAGLILLMLWQGLPLLQNQLLSVPMLLSMVLAVFGLNEVVMPLATQFMALGLSANARDRLNRLGTNQTTSSLKKHEKWPNKDWILEAQNITARQPGAIIGPNRVDFCLRRGEALMIFGRSGLGKSTLLDVLAGELQPQEDSLLLNGIPLHKYDHTEAMGYLAQQVDIFDLTLAENLRLGDANAKDDMLWQVLQKVGLSDWARSQPKGLHTQLGEYGAAISGGQARRIALARLLLKPREILLLDEPFVGLDAANRKQLETMLLQHQEQGALIIVSHQAPQSKKFKCLSLHMKKND